MALLLCLSFVFIAIAPGTSEAGIPTFDATNLIQNILTVLQEIMSVVNQGTQISNQAQQIANQVKSLSTLGDGLFNELNGLSNSNISDLDRLLSQARGIQFNVGQVNSEFDAMFPQGTDWDTIPINQFGSEFDRWNQNLSDSAKFSMNAQIIVNRVRENYNRMEQILNQSRGADGEVRQIQAANQSLALISSQLGDVTQTLAAGQRVTSTAVAASAAEKRAQAEAAGRLRDNYANKGPAPSKYTSINSLP
jgi:P-type conjugative transfer protein TrbJ